MVCKALWQPCKERASMRCKAMQGHAHTLMLKNIVISSWIPYGMAV